MKCLPILLMAIGAGLKLLEILLWRFFRPPAVFDLAVTYDPLGFWLANTITALLCDQWRVLPALSKPTLFDLLLIAGFGMECLLLGIAIQGLRRCLHRRPSSPVTVR